MSDTDTLAATPDGTTTDTTTTAAPVDDGIIDLDAQEEVRDEPAEGEGGEQPESEKAKEAEAETEKAAEAERKKLSGAQRNKIREQRLLQENAELQRRLEEATRQTPAAKTAGDDDRPPREEDYNGDWFAWQRALTAYDAGKAAREAIKGEFQTREQSEAQKRQGEIVRERQLAHAERVEDAREVIADFDQTVEGMKGVNVRNDVLEEIMSSDKSALIAYHLAKNPDKLNALNQMSGRELAREMGRLEATVRMPEAKKATSAPPPLGRQKGGASPLSQEAILASYLKSTYGERRR